MADVETQAKALGWVPKEEFRGDESRWVDAETFVRRGEEVMPLLKATNARLQHQVGELASRVDTAEEALKESQEAMKALIDAQNEMTLDAVKRSKANLRASIRAAREAQDWTSLEALEEQLDEVKETEASVKSKGIPTPKPLETKPAAPQVDPEFVAWNRENPWFGADKRKTALMIAVGQELRADPANKGLVGRPFYERCAEEAEATLNPRSAKHSKVDGGTGNGEPSGGRGGEKERSYAALPADARATCDRQVKQFVGANKPFKTAAEWQKHYAEIYYATE